MTLNLKSSTRVHTNHDKALKALMAEKMDKITLNVPKSLKRSFYSKTVNNDKNMTEVIVSYIKEYVGINE
jgi:hypothetical protein